MSHVRKSTPQRPRSTRARALILGTLTSAVALFLAGCTDSPSALDPAGPRSDRIATLFWVLLTVATIVFAVVMALFTIAVVRRRRPPGAMTNTETEAAGGAAPVWIGGIAIPAVILIAVFGFTLWTMAKLAEPSEASAATIEVVGHQWWWEVRYPDQNVVTANEIHIPVGEPVSIKLTGTEVNHSFWVPELSDKLDLIPGHTNTLWLQADKAGDYRGQCAEFCGVQHALMSILVVAEPVDQYTAWLGDQQSVPTQPDAGTMVQRGQQVFLSSACVYCHTIKGTNASGNLGPDLTHLASRRMIAAGTLENTRGNLAGWILNPQNIKPGNEMPAIQLPPDELQELLAYLETLQ